VSRSASSATSRRTADGRREKGTEFLGGGRRVLGLQSGHPLEHAWYGQIDPLQQHLPGQPGAVELPGGQDFHPNKVRGVRSCQT